MDALSCEWRRDLSYITGDRVAFKLGDTIGVAAFECIKARVYLSFNFWIPELNYCFVDVSSCANQASLHQIHMRGGSCIDPERSPWRVATSGGSIILGDSQGNRIKIYPSPLFISQSPIYFEQSDNPQYQLRRLIDRATIP